MNKLGKKVIFFLIIIFVPFTFFYLFSRGSQHFKRLPFFGPYSQDSVAFVYPDFAFTDYNGGVLNKEALKGKIIILTPVSSTCPDQCDFLVKPFRLDVYRGILEKNKEFSEVMILSEVFDTVNTRLYDFPEKFEVDPARWRFFMSSDHLLWDVDVTPGKHLLSKEDPDRPGKMMYSRSALLIDWNFHLRGWYDLAHSVELRRLIDELRLLRKEQHEINN
jgi:hypothetical protein